MNLLRDIIHAIRTGVDVFKFRRHLRRGGCPDLMPF